MAVSRKKNTVEKNPVGIPDAAVKKLLPELDAHLATLFIMVHQYQKHHWLVEGPQFRGLHLFLGELYDEVHKDVDAVAERITALGGIPTSDPVEQAKIAYIQHEKEGYHGVRPSLEKDRAEEGKIAVALRRTIKLAFDLGDYGTRGLLEKVLLQAEDRAHHLDHFLQEDSL